MVQVTPPHTLLEGAALFLDFDGTLVELAEAPDAIRVPADLHPLLERLSDRLEGRLGIISGRSIQDLERHLDCSGLAVSGSHGLELRLAGRRTEPVAAPEGLQEALGRAERFAERTPGVLIEPKAAGLAVHYRQSPEQEERVSALVAELAAATGLSIQRGKMVAELRPGGADKGDALRAMMREPEFAGARPLFMGDDLTDEDAFRAAADLGGAGILVGPERASAARWRLESVSAVAEWLNEAARR